MIKTKGIRQVAIMVEDLEKSVDFYRRAFDLEPYERQDLREFGLINAIIPVGPTILELLQPVDPNSAGARFLKRQGPGLYMLIFEIEDSAGGVKYLKEQGIPIVWQTESPEYGNIHLHPRAVHGVLIGLGEPRGANPWPPAGANWTPRRQRGNVRQIRQVALITEDQDTVVGQYHRLFGITPARYANLAFGLRAAYAPLGKSGTVLEFLQPIDPGSAGARFLKERGEGMYLLIMQVRDLDAAVRRAQEAGARVTQVVDSGHQRNAWLHPLSTGGVFMQLTQVTTPGTEWPPTGA
ncbi:MAG: VOC family protein [Chloroflexi bacterium]|nr:VOC family protein [Chloroflexota bacterium]